MNIFPGEKIADVQVNIDHLKSPGNRHAEEANIGLSELLVAMLSLPAMVSLLIERENITDTIARKSDSIGGRQVKLLQEDSANALPWTSILLVQGKNSRSLFGFQHWD